MRTLAFDGRMGASGDMILGALLAAGADPDVLAPVERELGVEYDIGTTTRCGIAATTVTVRRAAWGDDARGPDASEDGRSQGHDSHAHGHHPDGQGDEGGHHPDGQGDEGGHHPDGQGDGHAHVEGAGPQRSYYEVLDIVDDLDLERSVHSDATAIFEHLAAAEAAVHGTDIDDIHFHEVGADDAIADIVGATLLLADIDPERVVTTPLSAGDGTVEMSHGVYPIPPPAVSELAARADWSFRGGPVEGELLTPTGAAILAHVAEGVETLPALSVEANGYGAGDRTYPRYPNVLRVLVGDDSGPLQREAITVLETNLDDATPETLGALHETLADAGARDVSILPTTAKKSRPGHLLKVVVPPEDAEAVARELAAQTGTLGIRQHGSGHRFVADREVTSATVTVDGESFDVAVKRGSMGGEVFDVSAEFDDALAVARETGVPVRDIRRLAEQQVRKDPDRLRD